MTIHIHSKEDLCDITPTTSIRLHTSLSISRDEPLCSIFRGTLDGNGYTILGLEAPLFNSINSGTIKDLTISDSIVKNTNSGIICNNSFETTFSNIEIKGSYLRTNSEVLGGFTGESEDDTFTSCTVTDTQLVGGDHTGGLIGKQYGGLCKNCMTNSKITDSQISGGISGVLSESGVIKNCTTYGTVTGQTNVGGIVGENKFATIKECQNYADISGNSSVGGICGHLLGDTSYVQNSGQITGKTHVGGIAGVCNARTNHVTNEGKVSGERCVGGIFGVSKLSLSFAKNHGSVTGDTIVGGLVGDLDSNLKNSYSFGNIDGKRRVGGLIGKIDSLDDLEFNQLYCKGKVSGDSFVRPVIGDTANVTFTSSDIVWDISNIDGNDYIGTRRSLDKLKVDMLLNLT